MNVAPGPRPTHIRKSQLPPLVRQLSLRIPIALVPRRLRLLAGLAICITHGWMVFILTAFAKLYAYLSQSSLTAVDFKKLGPRVLGFSLPVQIACYSAAVTHGLALVYTLRSLFQLLCRPRRKVDSTIAFQSPYPTDIDIAHSKPTSCLSRLRWRLKALYKAVCAHPTEFAQLRLLVEVIMQTYQADKMSGFVATVWLNRLMVCVIVTNCWFTPVVYFVLRKRSSLTKQVVRLTIDTILDVVYGIGIPCIILYPYIRDFDKSFSSFPHDFYVRDTWVAVATAENRQVFVLSWADYFSKVGPWFFLWYRLQALRELVSVRDHPHRIHQSSTRSRVSWILHWVLVGWGIFVLGAHLNTELRSQRANVVGCLVELRPWVTTNSTALACSVYEISCAQRGISGAQHDIDYALSQVDPSRVQALITSHCHQLHMPPRILTFSALGTFKFYNTTIHEWGDDAMVTSTSHPALSQFFAVHTNFTTFPEGLLSPDFPQTVNDVKFIATNLSSLPDAFGTTWKGVLFLVMELCPQLREFPRTIASIRFPVYVSLNSNSIESIPDDIFATMVTGHLRVTNNPVKAIPNSTGNPYISNGLVIQSTEVEVIPDSWLATKDEPGRLNYTIWASRTPLCTKMMANTSSTEFHEGRFTVVCHDAVPNVTYPLELEYQWREANRG